MKRVHKIGTQITIVIVIILTKVLLEKYLTLKCALLCSQIHIQQSKEACYRRVSNFSFQEKYENTCTCIVPDKINRKNRRKHLPFTSPIRRPVLCELQNSYVTYESCLGIDEASSQNWHPNYYCDCDNSN
ncbi:hypothetical protein EGR_10500 [Echinococcus granulosus]|uniref:Uncharacterized protein n=1 Tax=Echinococcus granulosus TaxID=6210 RepID=W6U0T2_ECHGR|nr:hypothetical protein EGR_10500 [Echinococcus granulosus]EUB54648.1 hypothetical protein EGR_10500 [Echinococcus granulosus]